MNQQDCRSHNHLISSFSWGYLLAFLLGGLFGTELYAVTFQGSIHLIGSALKSRTLLEVSDPQQSNVLCPSELEQKVRHLTDLEIEVSGEWKLGSTGEPDCLVVSSYRVIKAASGRPIIVGTLTSRNGQYAVVTDGGGEVILAELPSGAKTLLGTRVIMDVKSIASSSNADATKVVVDFRPMP
jgi:hypothetical protein